MLITDKGYGKSHTEKKEEFPMMNAKKNSRDFFTQLFDSWLRVDTSYVQSKKDAAKDRGTAKKA